MRVEKVKRMKINEIAVKARSLEVSTDIVFAVEL